MAESKVHKPLNYTPKKSNRTPSPRKNSSPYQKSKCLLSQSQLVSEINSSLGKDTSHWSFSKSDRFKPMPKYTGPEYSNIKSAIGKTRAAGIGYGGRWQFGNPNGKDSPPPNTYKLPSCFDSPDNGPKISSPVRLDSKRNSTPGPGSYTIKTFVGEMPSFSFKGRHILRSRASAPPPGSYDPSHSLIESGRFTAIEFGRRSPSKFSSGGKTPGPGTYDLGSTFYSERSQSPMYKPIGFSKRTLSLDLSSFN